MASKSYKFEKTNRDSALNFEAVDISAADYTPTGGGLFRALNASVAGQITVVNAKGASVPVYVNLGWNSQGGKSVKHGGSGDSATILAAELDVNAT